VAGEHDGFAAVDDDDPADDTGPHSPRAGAVVPEDRVVLLPRRLAEARLNGAQADVVSRDAVRGYFVLLNTHDGSQAVWCQFTTVRVVC
jgi:hypothetical protein